jgi:exonuclease SbcC
MLALKERIDKLHKVEGAFCPFCGQPLSADERGRLITELEGEGKEMGNRHRANQEVQAAADGRVRDLQTRIASLGQCEEELRGQSRLHDRLEAERQRVQKALDGWQSGGATRLKEVTALLEEERFALDARAQLAEIDAQSKALGYDAAEHDAVRQAEQEGRESEAEIRTLEAARASLAPVERQLAALDGQIAQESASLADQESRYREAKDKYERERAEMPDVDALEAEVFALKEEENRLRLEVGMARQRVAVLDVQRERRERLSGQLHNLTVQIARLKTLEKAFSKDGVPALLIEQALPEIETQANELLDRLSGGAMSVRFATQVPFKDKAKKDLKETLDIIISDAAGPRAYELFSGGEAFRVNFAIRLALSKVLAQRAGARLQTLVIDEGFGSQDAEGRQRLIEAINLVREDFQKILVITHLEELKEAFSARIHVEKTPRGSRVQVLT